MKYCYRWMRRDEIGVDSALYDTRREAISARDMHYSHGVVCSPVVDVPDDYEPNHGYEESPSG
jgi:hypothetical protein